MILSFQERVFRSQRIAGRDMFEMMFAVLVHIWSSSPDRNCREGVSFHWFWVDAGLKAYEDRKIVRLYGVDRDCVCVFRLEDA